MLALPPRAQQKLKRTAHLNYLTPFLASIKCLNFFFFFWQSWCSENEPHWDPNLQTVRLISALPQVCSPACLLSLHVNLSRIKKKKNPKDEGDINAAWSQQFESKRLPRAATYRPTPTRCEELTPSAGPECTSNRSPKIIGMGADFSLNRCTSSVLTQDFIAVSREGITPDSLLTGRGERVCLHSSQSKKNDAVSARGSKMSTCKFDNF